MWFELALERFVAVLAVVFLLLLVAAFALGWFLAKL